MPPGKGGAGEEAKAAAKKAEKAGRGKKAAKAAEEPDADGSDSDDSSDSDGGGIEVDAETAKQLMAIEQELEANHSYDRHLECITLLRGAPSLRARLHAAYTALADRYPLGEDLWLAWINDTLEGVQGPEEVEQLMALMRRATQDYMSPAVWALYLDVAHDLDPQLRDGATPEAADRYRTLCEEALAAAGLHLGEGHKLWEKYRKFELAVEAAAQAGGSKAAASKAEDRLRALYARQLAVPLADNEAVLEEYKAWEAAHGKSVPAHVAKAAEKAREAAEVRAGCEAGVAADAPSDVAKLGAFLSYIKMEQAGGAGGDTAARVQCLYERAVAAFPATHSLWLQYGSYVEAEAKLPAAAAGVYRRAARNCPWVGVVWERAIRAMDRADVPVEEVDDTYARALAAGLQGAEDYMLVILARLDYLRRRAQAASDAAELAAAAGQAKGAKAAKAAAAAAAAAGAGLREAFKGAGELMLSSFPDHLDRSLRLPGYWAHCELHIMQDEAAAREVWEGAAKGGLGRYPEVWEAYIAMERSARNIEEARGVYKRVFGRRLEEDGQLRLCHAWLRFEREEGSADDYLLAHARVEPILEEAAAAAAAAADQAAAEAAKIAVKQAAKALTKEEIKAMRQANDPNLKKKKDAGKKDKGGKSKRGREAEPAEPQEEAGGEAAAAKRARHKEPEQAAAGEAEGAAAGTAAEGGDNDAEMAEGEAQEGEAGRGGAASSRQHYTDQQTVFVKGLRHGIKDADLEAFFKQHVPEGIKAIRIVRDAVTGQGRGFAYIECESREALDKAVAANGTTFQGIPLFIAESNPRAAGGGRGGRFEGGRGRGGRFDGGRGGRGSWYEGGRGGRYEGGRGGYHGGRHGGRGRGDGDTDMQEAGGEEHGGGRGYGGRGRPGLGHQREHMRAHLQVDEGQRGGAAPSALVPNSVRLAQAAGQPMSNDDFRKMLLGGKKE